MTCSWEHVCSRFIGYYMVLWIATLAVGDVPDVFFLVPPVAVLKRPMKPFSESRRSI